MRIVQSYNGAIDRNAEISRWMMALSVIYLNRIGAYPVLYTDSKGRKNLGEVLDLYKDVRKLEIPGWVDDRCFAAAKFFAMEQEPLGYVHIDNDVLLKKKTLLDRISDLMYGSDVVVQGIERYTDSAYEDCLDEYKKAGWIYSDELRHKTPLNTGLIVLMNHDLRSAYYAQYFEAIRCISRWLKGKDIPSCPDYLPEQAALYTLCKNRGYKIGEIIDRGTIEECNEQANEIGYAHFWGNSKVKQIESVKAKVRELDGAMASMLERRGRSTDECPND